MQDRNLLNQIIYYMAIGASLGKVAGALTRKHTTATLLGSLFGLVIAILTYPAGKIRRGYEITLD